MKTLHITFPIVVLCEVHSLLCSNRNFLSHIVAVLKSKNYTVLIYVPSANSLSYEDISLTRWLWRSRSICVLTCSLCNLNCLGELTSLYSHCCSTSVCSLVVLCSNLYSDSLFRSVTACRSDRYPILISRSYPRLVGSDVERSLTCHSSDSDSFLINIELWCFNRFILLTRNGSCYSEHTDKQMLDFHNVII